MIDLEAQVANVMLAHTPHRLFWTSEKAAMRSVKKCVGLGETRPAARE